MVQALVASCLNRAALPPEDVQYMALHGTGTPLGDPIEVGALSAPRCRHLAKPLPGMRWPLAPIRHALADRRTTKSQDLQLLSCS